MSTDSNEVPTVTESVQTQTNLEQLLERLLRNGISNVQQPNSNPSPSPSSVPNPVPEKVALNIKLEGGENYLLWARLMKVEIAVRGRSGHIIGET